MRLRILLSGLAVLVTVSSCAPTAPSAASGPPDDGATAPDMASGSPPAPSADSARLIADPRIPTAPSRRAQPGLQRLLEEFLADPEMHVDGPVGVMVLNDRGYPVLRHNADLPLLPASTMKLVTAAAALLALGPDHRFVTPVRATAPIDDVGLLAGDLVIVGSGDPALATPDFGEFAYGDRPRTRLEDLADALVDAGLRIVTGSVIGDPSKYADEPLAEGWPQRYIDDRHTSRVSALTVDRGLEITYHDDGRVIGVVSTDPAFTAAERLVELLEDRGVVIRGGPAASPTPPPTSLELARVESPPLTSMLRYAVQWSDNPLTDGIFRALGAEVEGDPTWAGSALAVRRALDGLDLDWSGTVLADGSGLSRDDRLTAAMLARLDLMMHRSEHAEAWSDLLAVAGRSGTLRMRLRGSLADGRLRGKTGTLDDVRALTGNVVGADGGRYHIAIVGNELRGGVGDRVRLLADEIVIALTEDLDGCVRETTVDPDDPAVSERRLVCPG
jgi:serine-type D-Ala-D-Ala carboxypeptidase/endopeptidase (penicillin-binding protein 4)